MLMLVIPINFFRPSIWFMLVPRFLLDPVQKKAVPVIVHQMLA
mgnify:CR=1 FL=1